MNASSPTDHPAYRELMRQLREIATLHSVAATLAWDQETMMPRAAGAHRAEELGLLSGLIHERRIDPRLEELLAASEADAALTADPLSAANLREIRRDRDRAALLPTALVREMAETTSRALEAWRDARERSDYAAFAPWLETVLRLNRAKAECYGAAGGDALYDALMEDYEPGARVTDIVPLFAGLRERLVPMIAAVREAKTQPDDAPYRARVLVAAQVELGRRMLGMIGFDLDAGRLDTSAHPFCEGVGPGDTRLTTRYAEDGFPDALSSTLHEMGHGLYEQGLPKAELFGQPLAEAVGLGIHESQSRLWENFVGRSRAFWEAALPEVKRTLGAPVEHFDVEQMYRAVNRVEPNLIRVDSDETTYNLHIMLRFDLERALLAGDLPVTELPAAWGERMWADLGLDVPDDRHGCLQDIHWSMGAIGYFPTYTLGNLYAAQLWEAIARDIPEVERQIARGEFSALLGWLREKVHRHGRRYSAAELCLRATGAPLGPEPLLRYLDSKLAAVYGI